MLHNTLRNFAHRQHVETGTAGSHVRRRLRSKQREPEADQLHRIFGIRDFVRIVRDALGGAATSAAAHDGSNVFLGFTG